MREDIANLLITRSRLEKKQDKFYGSFFNINSNVGNYLGQQLIRVDRPAISIDTINTGHKGSTFSDTGKLRFDPITVTFSDDEESVTAMLLYAQLMRQKKKYRGEVDHIIPAERHSEAWYKFGLKFELLNSKGDVTEGYIFKDCFISNISHSDGQYSGDGNNEITITIQYDNIDVKIFDQYISMTT